MTGNSGLVFYLAAFIVCIFSELTFTLYKNAYDTFNLLGHIYKLLGFYLIYRGIFAASVQLPYQRLVDTTNKLQIEISEKEKFPFA
jgi:hypothetical protein